jgi:hypothetical protein
MGTFHATVEEAEDEGKIGCKEECQQQWLGSVNAKSNADRARKKREWRRRRDQALRQQRAWKGSFTEAPREPRGRVKGPPPAGRQP